MIKKESKNEAINFCLETATSLLDSAKILQSKGKNNHSYHLALLGLEEIGKSVMLENSVDPILEDKKTLLEKGGDDHKQKLFWAFFSKVGIEEMVDPKIITSYKELAKNLHNKRLSSLYPEYDNLQSQEVSDKELDNAIKLTESRLFLEKSSPKKELTLQERNIFKWFLESVEDKEKSTFIFNKISIEKFKGFGNVMKWLKWLKSEFIKHENENKLAFQKELENIAKNKGTKDKWRYKILILSPSHSCRDKDFKEWNSLYSFVKFYAGKQSGKYKEVYLEFTLKNDISILKFWNFAWELSRRVILSLNIASRGFFWWKVSKDTSKFYEKLTDLEDNKECVIERSPRLEVDWGHNVLDENILKLTTIVYTKIPRPSSKYYEPFRYYLGGLTLLSKSDIHFRFEQHAFMNFFTALKIAMKNYKDYEEEADFLSCVNTIFSKIAPGLENEAEKTIKIGIDIENPSIKNPIESEINVSDVSMMKIFCDLYLLRKLREETIKKAL